MILPYVVIFTRPPCTIPLQEFPYHTGIRSTVPTYFFGDNNNNIGFPNGKKRGYVFGEGGTSFGFTQKQRILFIASLRTSIKNQCSQYIHPLPREFLEKRKEICMCHLFIIFFSISFPINSMITSYNKRKSQTKSHFYFPPT